MEVTVQQHLLAPVETDLGYIRVAGFQLPPRRQRIPADGSGGRVHPGGHHWLIEDNTVSDVNSVGIEIGTRSLETADRERVSLTASGPATARGVTSFAAITSTGAAAAASRASPSVGPSSRRTGSTTAAGGTWSACGRRGDQAAAQRGDAGRAQPDRADHGGRRNLAGLGQQEQPRDAEPCGGDPPVLQRVDLRRGARGARTGSTTTCCGTCAAPPSRPGDTDNLVVAHNLIGPSASVGVRAAVITDRTLDGRAMTARGNRVYGNIILGPGPGVLRDKGNISDHNVFGHPAFDLEAWRRRGEDAHGTKTAVDASYEAARAELAYSTKSDPARRPAPAPGRRRLLRGRRLLGDSGPRSLRRPLRAGGRPGSLARARLALTPGRMRRGVLVFDRARQGRLVSRCESAAPALH